ncbi:MAG: hypothetical protein IPJ41_04420 [Phycisphaerales bacterium]|nr:hypothetical protein [Phycisphaerales bacterium]
MPLHHAYSVVEDSEVLRGSLVDGLTQAGHAVDAVADGRQAMIHSQTTDYDLVVLRSDDPPRSTGSPCSGNCGPNGGTRTC